MIPQIAGLTLVFLAITAFQLPQNGGEKLKTSQSEQDGLCNVKNRTFQDGEEITYKLYYHLAPMWLAAGEVTFKVEEIGNQYHLSAEGTTYPFYEWFFKVRDYYDSYVDKETLLPSLSIRKIQEGKYTLYDKIFFDQKGRKAISDRGRTIETTKRTEYDLDDCMHDMLSVIYFSRNLEFEKFAPGHKFPIQIFMDEKAWPLSVEYIGKEEEKKIKGQGSFKAIQFSPDVIEGYVFKKGTRMNIWVSDDKNRIPLLIESPVSVGKIKAVLKDYDGLKYELTSKLD
jgi:hypothetical protein